MTGLLVMVWVGLGGALGAGLRHLLDRHVPAGRGVLLANAAACFGAGMLLGAAGGVATAVSAALLTAAAGALLGLGTWSTVAARAADHVLAGAPGSAAAVWGAHLGAGLTAAAAGGVLGLALG